MNGQWRKQGLIFDPAVHRRSWFASHAALPVPDRREGDVFRVYFSGRDSQGRAQIGYFEVDLRSPKTILALSEKPVIGLGGLGTFDDSGITSACLVNHEGRKYQYYSGWTLGTSVPFYFYIGLAVSSDRGESYQKVSEAPVLERNRVDPFLTASPCVLIESGLWKMWYVSGDRWKIENGRPKHFYHIRYAESRDGIAWQRDGRVCIDFEDEDEYALARPCVVRDNGLYKMWFSCRGSAYRLGYAESEDGLNWERNDEAAGLDTSESGWDSEMIAYAAVFEHKGVKHMLYNGNGYGATGIGHAIYEE